MSVVEIRTEDARTSRVIVNGHDITNIVTEVFSEHRAGWPPIVRVHVLAATLQRTGSADVRYIIAGAEFSEFELRELYRHVGPKLGDAPLGDDVANAATVAKLLAALGCDA